MLANEGLDLAGIEFVTDADGTRYTYDINGTTNYNADVEAQWEGLHGMGALADLVQRELSALQQKPAAK